MDAENTLWSSSKKRYCRACAKIRRHANRDRYKDYYRAISKRRVAEGFFKDYDKNSNLSETVIRNVMTALNDGATMVDLLGQRKDHKTKQIVRTPRLHAFCAANPKLGKIIYAKLEANRLARRSMILKPASPRIMRNASDAMRLINDALPRHLEPWRRDEARSKMLLAYVEGKLNLQDIPRRVGEFVTAQWRENSLYAPTGGKFLALDGPAYRSEDGRSMSLIETISEHQGMWR